MPDLAAGAPRSRAPNMVSSSSVRPAPISPAMPSISPARDVEVDAVDQARPHRGRPRVGQPQIRAPTARDAYRPSASRRRGAARRDGRTPGRRGRPSAGSARAARSAPIGTVPHQRAVAQHGDAVGRARRPPPSGARCRRSPRPRAASWRMIANSRSRLADRQRRGRLVHDQDAGVAATAPWRSRPAAARRRAASPTSVAGSRPEVQRLEQLGRGLHLPAAVDESRAPERLRARGRCSRPRVMLRHQVEFLVDDRDARARWRRACR